MHNVTLILQLIIALGIFNVWLLRTNRATDYRGGNAQTMEEEFRVYGFSRRFMYVIGAIKVTLAVLLLIGFWVPQLAAFAGFVMGALMLAAVLMHVKVHDPVKKAVPAFLMFLMSLLVFVLAGNVQSS